MRGDEWNTLVSAPTATDVDAALAEVRLRAVPIARRQARNRRATSMLVAILALGGAFWAGGLNAGTGVLVGAERREPNRPGYEGAPRLVLGHAPATARRDRPVYRITTWTEHAGERYGEAESWVGGPEGTAFALGFGYFDPDLLTSVMPTVSADSVVYMVESFRRTHFGRSARGLDLYEEGNARGRLAVPRGQALIMYPSDRAPAGEPQQVVRVDGPDIDVPRTLRWDSARASVERSWYSGPYSVFQQLDPGMAERETMARQFGVRVAKPRPGGLFVVGLIQPRVPVLRISLRGHSGHAEYVGRSTTQRLVVPGVADTLTMQAYWVPIGGMSRDGPAVCFSIWSERPAAGPGLAAGGCLTQSSGWNVANLVMPNGVRLHVDMPDRPSF